MFIGTNVGFPFFRPAAMLVLLTSVTLGTACASDASSDGTVSTTPTSTTPAPAATTRPSLGIGVKVGLLGPGIEVATAVSERSNIRAGFNAFYYGRTFTKDGITYDGGLHFRSAEAQWDWFPFAGVFHISPGVVYNRNQATADATVPPGQPFKLGYTLYTSDPNNPITGHGSLNFNKVAPSFRFGWGNLVPRNSKRFSVSCEFGVLYQGSPRSALALNGNACSLNGCQNVNSDPNIQANVQKEQRKIDSSMSFFKFYPIISTGISYRF